MFIWLVLFFFIIYVFISFGNCQGLEPSMVVVVVVVVVIFFLHNLLYPTEERQINWKSSSSSSPFRKKESEAEEEEEENREKKKKKKRWDSREKRSWSKISLMQRHRRWAIRFVEVQLNRYAVGVRAAAKKKFFLFFIHYFFPSLVCEEFFVSIVKF